MQPEALGNLKKAGRASTKSFGENSFHNYMARKIHMQREQFGVVLPPPPPPEETKEKQTTLPQTPKSPPALKKHPRFSPSFSRSENRPQDTSSSRRVSFAPESIAASNNSSTRKFYRKKRGSRGTAVHSILKKLKRRHGRRSSSSKSEIDDHDDGDDDDDDKSIWSMETESMAKQPDKLPQTLERLNDQEKSPINTVTKNIPVTRSSPLSKQKDEKTKQNDKLPSPEPGHVSQKRPRDRPDLFFQGVVVMVNGYTRPDSDTIQRLLHRHGGDLEKYETVRITHIIAEHLSDAKAKMYKRQKNPRPVVYPEWILDSIKAQRQLPASQYIIKEMLPDDAKTQPSLASFFNKPSVSKDEHSTGDKYSERKVSPRKNGTDTAPSMERAIQSNQSPHLAKAQDHTSESGSSAMPTAEPPGQASPESRPEAAYLSPQKQSPKTTHKGSPVSPGRTDDMYIGGTIRTVGTDPHFLESFFSNSRLSYIGSFALRSHRPSNSSKRKARPCGPHRRFVFHIDMDCFFAAGKWRREVFFYTTLFAF